MLTFNPTTQEAEAIAGRALKSETSLVVLSQPGLHSEILFQKTRERQRDTHTCREWQSTPRGADSEVEFVFKKYFNKKLKITGWESWQAQCSWSRQVRALLFPYFLSGTWQDKGVIESYNAAQKQRLVLGRGEFEVYSTHLCLYIGKWEFPFMLLLSPCSAEHIQAFIIMYHIEECTVCSKVLLVAVSMLINASLRKF